MHCLPFGLGRWAAPNSSAIILLPCLCTCSSLCHHYHPPCCCSPSGLFSGHNKLIPFPLRAHGEGHLLCKSQLKCLYLLEACLMDKVNHFLCVLTVSYVHFHWSTCLIALIRSKAHEYWLKIKYIHKLITYTRLNSWEQNLGLHSSL